MQGSGAVRFARKPDSAIRLVLIFGDDEGVVADTAGSLISAWQKEAPASVISLDDDEIKREPVTLFDAIEAQSLLGDTNILRIRTKGEKLFAILKDVLAMAEDAPQRIAARVIVQNGALNTRSKLRTAFEQANQAAALHVFADDADAITSRVTALLDAEAQGIAPDALARFVGGLPGHRSLANAEITKLGLYAYGLDRPVNVADIRALCETNADENSRVAVTLALNGEVDAAQTELDRVIDAGFSPIGLLRQFEMEASRMLSAHALRGTGGGNIGMKLRPPVWQSDWPAFESRLKKWPVPRLVRLLERVHDMELAAKSPGGAGLSEAATRELFVRLAVAAAV
ncbi:MAG: DNA polymerase III subunit delta [Pseudomonadota bacterium]